MAYTIEEHKHRFSAWAAGTASRVKNCRFTVEQAKKILEKAGLKQVLLDGPERLPSPQDIDTYHKKWRESVIEAAKEFKLNFTHGVAAKLINMYLKSAFICGGYHEHDNVKSLHPPIDKVLLDALSQSKEAVSYKAAWSAARKIRWSKLNSQEYENVIRNIRAFMADQALWKVEKYWQGHQ